MFAVNGPTTYCAATWAIWREPTNETLPNSGVTELLWVRSAVPTPSAPSFFAKIYPAATLRGPRVYAAAPEIVSCDETLPATPPNAYINSYCKPPYIGLVYLIELSIRNVLSLLSAPPGVVNAGP